jgi:hypothetical protein
MTRTSAWLAIIAVVALGIIAPAPAQAANSKSFVSSVGSDANDCASIATACRNFQRAHDQTLADGQISCIDNLESSLGATITKSITIDCAGTSATTIGFRVIAPGAAVVIRNLAFVMSGTGIDFQSGAALTVENCVFRGTGGKEFGLVFRSSATGARLFVTNTLLSHLGNSQEGAGLVVSPAGSGSADVLLDRVRAENNSYGVFVYAPPGTNGIRLTMRDSTVAGNNFTGFTAQSDGPTITAMIDNSAISNNGGTGVFSQGANSFVFVNRSTISGNDTGWTAAGGGNLVTEGTNSVYLNRTSNGAPSASIGLQ